MEVVIDSFKGLSVKREDAPNGIVLYAKSAVNVDLRSGTLKPFKSNISIEPGHTGEFIKYDSEWFSGDENYIAQTINGFELLIFKRNDAWHRIVRQPRTTPGQANTIVPLGLPRPKSPVVQTIPGGEDTQKAAEGFWFEVGYAVTTVRDIDGYRDESGPSDIVWVKNETEIAFRITFEDELTEGVVGRNVYRISTAYSPTSTFQLVAELGVAESYYEDMKQNNELKGAIAGLFDDDGVQVLRSPPDVVFDGICPDVYYGQLIAWKGRQVYISEPDHPESYPPQYQLTANDSIIAIRAYRNDLYIFTASGIQRCIGQDPLNMTILPGFIGDRIVNKRAVVACELGLFYQSRRSIGRITGEGHHPISRYPLGEDYFKKINSSSVHLAYGNGMVYFFHDAGTILFMEEQGIGFVELSDGYEASFYENQSGIMHVVKDGYIQQLFEGTEVLEFNYELGDLVLNEPGGKDFDHLEFFGRGRFGAQLYLDRQPKSNRVLDLDGGYFGRVIGFPYGLARGASWGVLGRGEISEIKAIVYE